jgi:hypothetical protein
LVLRPLHGKKKIVVTVSDSRRLVRRDYREPGRLNDINSRTFPGDAGDGLAKIVLTTITLGV